MNRKSLLIILILVIALGVILWFVFSKQSPIGPGSETPSDFNPFPTGSSTVGGPQLPGQSTSTIPTSSSTPQVINLADKACAGSKNVFEKNDCITDLAESEGDKSLCDAVIGSLAQQECRNGKDSSQPTVVFQPSSNQAYEALIKSYAATVASTGVTSPVPTESRPSITLPEPNTSINEAMIRNSLTFGAPLAVYAPSRYQVSPGASLKIYGSGFTKTGNTVYIGSQQTVVDSSDGATLDIIAPGVTGDYEVWVTNSKGSSKVATRTVKLLVTNSPAALPVIEKATPSPVSIDGTVTLTGTGFGTSNNILTSMGVLENVQSNGTSLSFPISSLPYSSYSKAVPELKGKVIKLLVNIQTSGGAAEKLFEVDVQF